MQFSWWVSVLSFYADVHEIESCWSQYFILLFEILNMLRIIIIIIVVVSANNLLLKYRPWLR